MADQIVVEEIKKANLYDKVFQCFAIMTGAYSTAVKGDARVFAEVVAFRVYESEDVMTSDWVYNEVLNVLRVVYDTTTKPPATLEWE